MLFVTMKKINFSSVHYFNLYDSVEMDLLKINFHGLYFSLSSGFFSQKVLNNHKQFCLHHQPVSTIFPVEGVNGAFKVKENKFQFALILILKLF